MVKPLPMALRYALLSGHPRKQLNFTLDSLHAAESALKALARFSEGVAAGAKALEEGASTVFDGVFRALGDDLNTPAALGALFTAVNATDPRGATLADKAAFNRVIYALGLDLSTTSANASKPSVPEAVEHLAKLRWEAKKSKDFAAADRLRAEIAASGYSMLDGKDGYKLEALRKA